MDVGAENEPRPAVRLLGVPDPRRGPPERLLEEADRVLQVEPPDVGPPQEVEVRLAFAGEPKPQLLRLAGLAGELGYLHQDYGAPHDGRPLATIALCYASGPWVQTRPSPDAHLAVAPGEATVLAGGLRPGLRIGQGEFAAVAAWAPDRSRLGLVRVGVEGTVGVQPHQDVGAVAFQAALQLDGGVTRVEDEQRDRPAGPGLPMQQVLHLGHGHLVGVFLRVDAPRVRRGDPRVALEGKPGDQLVGPPGHDGLARGVPRGVVVVTPPRAGLRVAAAPDAHVHSVNRDMARLVRSGGVPG